MSQSVIVKTSSTPIRVAQLGTLALGLLLSGLGTAAAADRPGTKYGEALSVAVGYGDLDLSGDEGLGVLYARLRSAARRVCRPLESRDLHWKQLYRQCYSSALADAVARTGSTRLAALHSNVLHSGASPQTVPAAIRSVSVLR